jgi:hypothetical protein
MEKKIPGLVDLKDAAYNPRRISAEALAGLKTSLVEFGDLAGITWNATTGNLVCGHQRLRALRTLHGEKLTMEGDAIVTPDGQRYPVRVVEWDELTEKAANVAANNPHIAGEFDDEALAPLLEEIGDQCEGLFADLRLDELVAIEEDLPEPPDVHAYQQQWAVMVVCRDEAHQRDVYDALRAEGHECKVVVT